jgi:hypothetical protein
MPETLLNKSVSHRHKVHTHYTQYAQRGSERSCEGESSKKVTKIFSMVDYGSVCDKLKLEPRGGGGGGGVVCTYIVFVDLCRRRQRVLCAHHGIIME